jgi:outer membrane protein assembly factor BamB
MLGNLRNTGLSTVQSSAVAKPWLFEDLGSDRAILGAPALDADGTLYIGADSLYALDGATGKMRWGKHVSNLVLCPPVVGLNNTVYGSVDFKNFCAYDGRSGAVLWRFQCKPDTQPWKNADGTPGPQNTFSGFSSAGALSTDGTLYVMSLEGRLYALDSKTGEERWRFSTHYQLYGSPTIGEDGTVYFTSVGTLFAVDGKTSKKRWDVTGCDVRGPVAIGADGTLYVTTYRRLEGGVNHYACSMCALNGSTGEREWAFPLGEGAAAAPSVGDDGTVFVSYEDKAQGPTTGRVIAIEGKTGVKRWAFETTGGSILAPAIGADGTIYIGSKGGVMYALDGTTGGPKWQVDIGAEIGTPVAVGNNGLIYFGANDGTVYALRAKDGARAPRPK